MNKRFVHIFMILTLVLLLAGCKGEPAAPATTPTAATAAPTQATTVPTEATIPTEEITVPTETLPTAATEPSEEEEPTEPEIFEDADSSLPYKQRIERADQAIYSGPGSAYKLVGTVKEKGVYTIVEESVDSEGNLWGKLKSGAGWVNLTEIQSGNDDGLPYRQRIARFDQSIYSGPGYDYGYVDIVRERGVYTIVDESVDSEGNLWGKLKSGIGWVDLTEIRSEDYENALMSANYADENLMIHGAYHHYSSNNEFRIPVAFRAYGKLRNVALFAMDFSPEGLVPGADIYTLAEMTEEMPLVAELDFPGDMSMYGIRFVDEAGVTHTYHIFISGRNGALEFDKA